MMNCCDQAVSTSLCDLMFLLVDKLGRVLRRVAGKDEETGDLFKGRRKELNMEADFGIPWSLAAGQAQSMVVLNDQLNVPQPV